MRRHVGHLTSEGEFFHRLDVELIENMRRRAELEQERLRRAEISKRRCAELEQQRLRMIQTTGIDDPDILQALQKTGYNPATASLLPLAPLVQVAWIDGSVSRAERKLVLAIASRHGVKSDSPAYNQISGWLERRPPERLFQESCHALRAALQALPPDDRKAMQDNLMMECRAVAAVSGSIVKRICPSESGLLDRLKEELKTPRGAARSTDAGG